MFSRRYRDEIIQYYRKSDWGYKHIWYRGNSWGLHHGLQDTATKNHTEALINQYKLIITEANIQKGMHVLDAGCGVGGAVIHIAAMTGANVEGITLVPEQVKSAQINVRAMGVAEITHFQNMDYTATTFPDGYFDVVFGIESICYAAPKCDFLREAFRITKKGGRLVIVDGYLTRKPVTQQEKKLTRDVCLDWHFRQAVSVADMTRDIRQSGWKVQKVINKTRSIDMSLRRLRIFGWLGSFLPLTQGLKDNALAARAWTQGVQQGLFGYFVHVAQK